MTQPNLWSPLSTGQWFRKVGRIVSNDALRVERGRNPSVLPLPHLPSHQGLQGDLTGLAYLTEASDRPLLAIVGGERLEPRLKLIDGLLDIVDILAIGGGLSMTLLAAAHAGSVGCGAGRKRPRKWGKGSVGFPRDPLDVLVPARRLLVKARKKGVEVIWTSG